MNFHSILKGFGFATLYGIVGAMKMLKVEKDNNNNNKKSRRTLWLGGLTF